MLQILLRYEQQLSLWFGSLALKASRQTEYHVVAKVNRVLDGVVKARDGVRGRGAPHEV